MTTDTRKTYDRLTTQEMFEIGKFLEPILVVTKAAELAPDRIVEYKDDWNDAKVAAKFSVSVANVAGLRARGFGKIDRTKAAARGGKKPGFRNPLVLSWERIKASEERIKALEERVTALEDALTSADEDQADILKTGSYSYTNGS